MGSLATLTNLDATSIMNFHSYEDQFIDNGLDQISSIPRTTSSMMGAVYPAPYSAPRRPSYTASLKRKASNNSRRSIKTFSPQGTEVQLNSENLSNSGILRLLEQSGLANVLSQALNYNAATRNVKSLLHLLKNILNSSPWPNENQVRYIIYLSVIIHQQFLI